MNMNFQGLDLSQILERPDLMVAIATGACLLCGLVYMTCLKKAGKQNKPNWSTDKGQMFPVNTELLVNAAENGSKGTPSGINFKYPPSEAGRYKKFRATFLSLDELKEEDKTKLERLLMDWASEVFHIYGAAADVYQKTMHTLSHSSSEYVKIMDTLNSLNDDIKEIEEEANELNKDWGNKEKEVDDEDNKVEAGSETSSLEVNESKDAVATKTMKKKGKKVMRKNEAYIFDPSICINWKRSRGVGQYNNLRSETW